MDKLIGQAEAFERIAVSTENREMYLNAAEMYLKASEDAENAYMKKQLVLKAEAMYNKSQEAPIKIMNMQKKITDKSFKDIGGLEKVKEKIKLAIIEPLKHPEVYKHFGKKVGGGILMYGPPGCGKSLIAEAAAGESEAAFFNVKASDLKSKYVGETEKNIADLFNEAKKHEAAIIFFDEFESLGGERSNMTQSHDKSMVSQLLTEMDGVGNKEKNILLIAATNEPWNVDVALRRSGRFGSSIFIPPPDFEARKNIFILNLDKKPIAENVNIEELALLTNSFSGADIMGICEDAIEIPLKEYFDNGRKRNISMQDFYKVLSNRNSSVTQWYQLAKIHMDDSMLKEIEASATA
ncbi:ATP-binding protein [Candidatus Woesearchaeota archaeon]|nr:ATP-binding protein [Candidatus Woesearchaeota archaeon]